MLPEAKSKDLVLWQTWKRTQSPMDLQRLLDQILPILNREVSKWAPSISRSWLDSEAKRLAIEAFRLYDPNRGVALSTYVASRIVKLSRKVYETQNAARSSESTTLGFNVFHTATAQ